MVTEKRMMQRKSRQIEQRRIILNQNIKMYQACRQTIDQMVLQIKEIKKNQQINSDQRIFEAQLREQIRLSSQRSTQDTIQTQNNLTQSHFKDYIQTIGQIMLNNLIIPIANAVLLNIDKKFQNYDSILKLTNYCDSIAEKITKEIQTFSNGNKLFSRIVNQIAVEDTFSAQKIAYVHYRQFQHVFKQVRQKFEKSEEIKVFGQKIDQELQFLKGIRLDQYTNNFFPSLEFKKNEEQQQIQKGEIKNLLAEIQITSQTELRRKIILI